MSQMKTFFTYAILLGLLFIVSTLLEKGEISLMYVPIFGSADKSTECTVDVEEAKATKVNGYLTFKINNLSENDFEKKFLQIDLINNHGKVISTEYAEVDNILAGDCKNYKVKFKGRNVKKYNIKVVESIPDNSNIINILGWEIDKTNVAGTGIDLTNVYGVDVTQYMSLSGIYNLATDTGEKGIEVAKDVPIWAYFFGVLTILWYI